MKITISLGSITQANRASRLFAAEYIQNDIIREDPKKRRKGCGYSLRIPKEKRNEAEYILKQNGIKYEIYEW